MAGKSSMPVIRGPVFCGAALRDPTKPGMTCRQPAGKKTGHPRYGRCWLHGGNSPTHYAAARAMMVRDVADIFAVPREVDPVDGLIDLFQRSMGLVDAYEALASQLSPDEMFWGETSVEETRVMTGGEGDGGESTTPPERKTKSGPGLNMIIKQYDAERDRAAKLGEAIIKLDLEGRRIDIGQAHVAAMVQIFLDPELGLSEAQRRTAARLLRASERPAIEGEVAA